jgi:hypothetical protein
VEILWRRHHQVPADEGERGDVAGFHHCHLAAPVRKEKRGEPGEGSRPVEPHAARLCAPASLVPATEGSNGILPIHETARPEVNAPSESSLVADVFDTAAQCKAALADVRDMPRNSDIGNSRPNPPHATR